MAIKRSGLMLDASWEPFAALARMWSDGGEEEKVLSWHSSLSGERRAEFACSLSSLGELVSPEPGVVCPRFAALPASARRALVFLLARRSTTLPGAVLAHLAHRVPELMALPELSAAAAASIEKEKEAKRRRKENVESVLAESSQRYDVVLEGNSQRRESQVSLVLSSPSLSEPSEEEDGAMRKRSRSDGAGDEQEADDGGAAVLESLRLKMAQQEEDITSQEQQRKKLEFSFEEAALLNDPDSAARVAPCLERVDDEALERFFAACGTGVDAAVGSRGLSALVTTVLLPRVLALQKNASRPLASTVQHCARYHGRVCVASVLVPVLAQNSDTPQCELVVRCLDELEDVQVFVDAFVAEHGFEWSDGTIGVVHKMVQISTLSDGQCAALLAQMQRQVAAHAANIKFAKLMLAFAVKFAPSVMKPDTLEEARGLARQLTSFLGKTVIQKLT